MTDREAIRRLAEIANALAIESRDTTIMQEAGQLIRDLSEPAAPTDEVKPYCLECHSYAPCRCTPTVTREQAEWVSDVIQTKWYDMRAKQDDEREAPPVRYEMPAFFRAVADALEGE